MIIGASSSFYARCSFLLVGTSSYLIIILPSFPSSLLYHPFASITAILERTPLLDEFFSECQEHSFEAREVLPEGD